MGFSQIGKGGLTPERLLAVVASVAVVGAVVAGLYLSGSPAKQRALRLDAERLSSLQSIASGIDVYYQKYGRNPDSLDVINGTDPNQVSYVSPDSMKDPETKAPYAYRQTGGDTYELCATFALPSPAQDERTQYGIYGPSWDHPAGDHCFSIDSKQRTTDLKRMDFVPDAAGGTYPAGEAPVYEPGMEAR